MSRQKRDAYRHLLCHIDGRCVHAQVLDHVEGERNGEEGAGQLKEEGTQSDGHVQGRPGRHELLGIRVPGFFLRPSGKGGRGTGREGGRGVGGARVMGAVDDCGSVNREHMEAGPGSERKARSKTGERTEEGDRCREGRTRAVS